MSSLVECPACEGRGTCCLRVNDGTWSELLILDIPCHLCNGKRRLPFADVIEYNFGEVRPAYPFADVD